MSVSPHALTYPCTRPILPQGPGLCLGPVRWLWPPISPSPSLPSLQASPFPYGPGLCLGSLWRLWPSHIPMSPSPSASQARSLTPRTRPAAGPCALVLASSYTSVAQPLSPAGRDSPPEAQACAWALYHRRTDVWTSRQKLGKGQSVKAVRSLYMGSCVMLCFVNCVQKLSHIPEVSTSMCTQCVSSLSHTWIERWNRFG